MNLTTAQERAVLFRGASLAVPASAGSGKTATLARRCVGLLIDLDAPCDPRRILVMTFTRAAAGELKSRIASLMREEAARAASPDRRRWIRRQESLLEQAEIGTIDAWCGRIVRENYSAAGVDPAFRVLATDEHRLLRATVADEVIDWVYASSEPAALAARDWALRGRQAGDASFRNALFELHQFRERLINPDQWIARERSRLEAATRGDSSTIPLLADEFRREMLFQYSQFDAIRSRCEDPRAAAMIDQYRAALENWTARLEQPSAFVATVAAVSDYRFPSAPRGKAALGDADKAVVTRVRDKWLKRRLKERWVPRDVEALLANAPRAASLALALLDLSREFASRLASARLRGSSMSFGDVQRAALDLLGTAHGLDQRIPTHLATRLAERYDHILVDEYQDTSGIQESLIRLIHGRAAESNRFLVGDVKQSIYAFRQAEPAIFMDIIARFEQPAPPSPPDRERGSVQRLSENFRSHPAVIHGVNALFSPLMTRPFGGADYAAEDALVAGRDDPMGPGDSPRVRIERIDSRAADGPAERPDDPDDEVDGSQSPDDGGSTDSENGDDDAAEIELVEREAAVIARRIVEALASGITIPIDRDPRGARRLPALGDFVVLMRAARGSAPRMAVRLRELGIPAVAAGRESMLDSLEVSDVRCVLSLLLNRRDDVALASYLRGPMTALPDADLLAIREASAGPLIDAVLAALSEDAVTFVDPGRGGLDRLAFAIDRLERWTALARHADVATVVARVIQDGALELHAWALRGGEFRASMLASLRDAAAAFSDGGGSLAGFVHHLDSLEEEHSAPEIAATTGGGSVRVLTIHAAKGLEFPFVFVAGTGRRLLPHRGGLVTCDADLGLSVSFFDSTARRQIDSPESIPIRRKTDHGGREEELRLLYVAATRAREYLWIVGHADEPSVEPMLDGAGLVPMIDRLSARSSLDWLLAAGLAGSPHVSHSTWTQQQCAEVSEVTLPPSIEVESEAMDDSNWLRASIELLASVDPLDQANLPASLSVSGLKRGLQSNDASIRDDRPVVAEQAVDTGPRWRHPTGTVEDAEQRPRDGRLVGTAVHRFLRHADMKHLGDAGSVTREAARLVDAGFLSSEDAALLPPDDLAWLCAQPVMVRAGMPGVLARRETPFTCAMPLDPPGTRVLVRGVIDLLFESPSGLTLIDYKTDRPRSADEWRERVSAYSLQLQTYAVAAEAAFGKPVVSLMLLFLGPRRVIDVPLAPERVRSVIQSIIAPREALRPPLEED